MDSLVVDDYESIHKKTYVWKKEKGCAITITEKGRKNILNPDQTIVWEEIDDIKTLKDITEIYAEKKSINYADALNQVSNIIDVLEKVQLISLENYLWLEDI